MNYEDIVKGSVNKAYELLTEEHEEPATRETNESIAIRTQGLIEIAKFSAQLDALQDQRLRSIASQVGLTEGQ